MMFGGERGCWGGRVSAREPRDSVIPKGWSVCIKGRGWTLPTVSEIC